MKLKLVYNTTPEQNSEFITTLKTVVVNQRVKFSEEGHPYKVMARSDRYIVLTKPFNAKKTVLYTIIDLVDNVRGTENLLFGASFETSKSCEEAIQRLHGLGNYLDFTTTISHRNRVNLNIDYIKEQSKIVVKK